MEQRRIDDETKKASGFASDKTVRQNLEKLKSDLNFSIKSGFKQGEESEEEKKKNDSVLDAQIKDIIKKENHKLSSGFQISQEKK